MITTTQVRAAEVFMELAEVWKTMDQYGVDKKLCHTQVERCLQGAFATLTETIQQVKLAPPSMSTVPASLLPKKGQGKWLRTSTR